MSGRRLDAGGTDRPVATRSGSRSTAASTRASKATPSRARCWPTASTWCAARRSSAGRAASSRPASRSRARSSRSPGRGSSRSSPRRWSTSLTVLWRRAGRAWAVAGDAASHQASVTRNRTRGDADRRERRRRASTVARAAAERGERVLLVEREPYLAGSGLDRGPEGVELLVDATALGVYDDGYVVVLHDGPEHDTVWHVRAARVVLATGALERPIAFADNDRPGVMLNAAVGRYIRDFGVLPGARDRGVRRERRRCLRRTTSGRPAPRSSRLRTSARDGPSPAPRATLAWRRCIWSDPAANGAPSRPICVAVAGGWNPALQLYRAIGGGLRYDEELATFVPDGIGAAVARGGRRGRRRRCPRASRTGTRRPRISRGTSSTSSAIRPSRTCSRRSTAACGASST